MKRRRTPYTRARLVRAMERAGSRFLKGEVLSHDSILVGRCACGRNVSKSAIDWQRTPGGCKQCRPERMIAAISERTRKEAVLWAGANGGTVAFPDGAINANTKLQWQCRDGHRWKTRLLLVRNGSWRRDCAGLIVEAKVRSIIEQALGCSMERSRPTFLGGMELDGFNLRRRVAFEYQGEYHDDPRQMERDARKRRLCASAGVALIEIHYRDNCLGTPGLRHAIARELARLSITPVRSPLAVSAARSPASITATAKERFADLCRGNGWEWDPETWRGQDCKILVDPKDGGGSVLALPRTVLRGHQPGRLARNNPLGRPEQAKRLAKHGWRFAPDCPSTSNAHQRLRLIDPHGRMRLMNWNKWQQRVEARPRRGLPVGSVIRRLRLCEAGPAVAESPSSQSSRPLDRRPSR